MPDKNNPHDLEPIPTTEAHSQNKGNSHDLKGTTIDTENTQAQITEPNNTDRPQALAGPSITQKTPLLSASTCITQTTALTDPHSQTNRSTSTHNHQPKKNLLVNFNGTSIYDNSQENGLCNAILRAVHSHNPETSKLYTYSGPVGSNIFFDHHYEQEAHTLAKEILRACNEHNIGTVLFTAWSRGGLRFAHVAMMLERWRSDIKIAAVLCDATCGNDWAKHYLTADFTHSKNIVTIMHLCATIKRPHFNSLLFHPSCPDTISPSGTRNAPIVCNLPFPCDHSEFNLPTGTNMPTLLITLVKQSLDLLASSSPSTSPLQMPTQAPVPTQHGEKTISLNTPISVSKLIASTPHPEVHYSPMSEFNPLSRPFIAIKDILNNIHKGLGVHRLYTPAFTAYYALHLLQNQPQPIDLRPEHMEELEYYKLLGTQVLPFTFKFSEKVEVAQLILNLRIEAYFELHRLRWRNRHNNLEDDLKKILFSKTFAKAWKDQDSTRLSSLFLDVSVRLYAFGGLLKECAEFIDQVLPKTSTFTQAPSERPFFGEYAFPCDRITFCGTLRQSFWAGVMSSLREWLTGLNPTTLLTFNFFRSSQPSPREQSLSLL